MALDPHLVAQVLRTPRTQDVTSTPIVRAVLLNDPGNAGELVAALETEGTLEAFNARKILCVFEANAAPFLVAKLLDAGVRARKEGLEILWALLVAEEDHVLRETLGAIQGDLFRLMEDTRPLPDEMPEHIERDFRGRICDLVYLVVNQLLDRRADFSLFRSMEDPERDQQIKRFKMRDFGRNIG